MLSYVFYRAVSEQRHTMASHFCWQVSNCERGTCLLLQLSGKRFGAVLVAFDAAPEQAVERLVFVQIIALIEQERACGMLDDAQRGAARPPLIA